MMNQILKNVLIDLDVFSLKLIFKGSNRKPLILNFDNPNRRFYCALIALIIVKMKIKKEVCYIDITEQGEDLEKIDPVVHETAA